MIEEIQNYATYLSDNLMMILYRPDMKLSHHNGEETAHDYYYVCAEGHCSNDKDSYAFTAY